MQKQWVSRALQFLEQSLSPPAHELNELDWKLELSPNSEKLSMHVSAFANYNGGGFLAFGIDKHGTPIGLEATSNSKIIDTMGNIARTNVHPSISIDHHVADFKVSKILFIHIAESIEKPVHLIKGGLENSYIRSGGQTRKMSKQELAQVLLNSKVPRYEELNAFSSDSAAETLNRLDYERFYSLQRREVPSSQEKIIEDLISQKIICRVAEKFSITNLGVLLRACYQHCCLKYIANQKMTNTTLRERLGIEESNYPMVSKIIAEAVKAGKVRKADPAIKSNKYTHYIPYWA